MAVPHRLEAYAPLRGDKTSPQTAGAFWNDTGSPKPGTISANFQNVLEDRT
jgi:hypothetical protein